MYGIRLDNMVVLDLDTKDDELVRHLEARFGLAAVHVETPRGRHLYYTNVGYPLPNLRAKEGLLVDVKAGANHYVVGPISIRPCGGTYTDRVGRLGVTTLTPFRDVQFDLTAPKMAPAARASGRRVEAGNRHHYLVERAVAEVANCGSEDELLCVLLAARDAECACSSEVQEAEVRDIANWAFKLYRSGDLTAASGGHFRTCRYFATALQPDTSASGLYALLCNQHGHQRGKTFALKHAAMREAKLTNLSERAFTAAVKKLLSVGAIEVALNHQAGKRHRQYKLAQPPSKL